MWSLAKEGVNLLFVSMVMIEQILGNDYMMTCSRPVMSKTPRLLKHDLGLPCDLSKESWCNLPGEKYPWHAVRSFVFENQGLMRRMYGEVRQLSVLRMEFNGNSIDESNSVGREFDETFRPVVTRKSTATPSPTASTTTPRPASTTGTPVAEVTSSIHEEGGKVTSSTPLVTQFVTVDSLISSGTPPTPAASVGSAAAEVESDNRTGGLRNESESVGGGALLSAHSSLDQMIKFMEDLNEESGVGGGFPTTTEESGAHGLGTEAGTTVSFEEDDGTTILTSTTEESGQLLFQDAERTTMMRTTTESPLREDSDGIQQIHRADIKGVNACPVKEEVVAPYWANNTRGEVLALLNLYPFEQYIHWEKCTFEHRQMYCRDGCRCEQQYRLHRLLAFDPTNECRGIFSDWFRFPSCCVCKCYLTSSDLAQERFSFNRSPRLEDIDADVPDVNGVDDSHFYYKNNKSRQPRK